MNPFMLFLQQNDTEVFNEINQTWTNPVFDKVMPLITQYSNIKYAALVFFALALMKRKLFGLAVIVTCCVAVLIADTSTSNLIKPFFQRERPNTAEKSTRLLIEPQKNYSFPSNHAANCFAFATVILLTVEGGAGLLAFILAALVGYSRIYVGVHYPLDIVGGLITGFIAGVIAFSLLTVLLAQAPEKKVSSEGVEWRKKKYYNNRPRPKSRR